MSASAHQSDHRDHRDWGKGWLMVCQTVKDDHRYPGHDRNDMTGDNHTGGYGDSNSTIDSRYRYGHDNQDHNRYEGRYLVRDSRGTGYWVTLTGKSDCESVRVNKGWAKVSVVIRPDNTWLKSDRSIWVKVKKYDTATANFYYQAKRASRHDGNNHDGHYDSATR
ncbi:hypothetical protein SAMN05216199_1839 [Pedococcus cremeus]|uniref:Uncharacterized protein n=2 Tax=Pedococcus cremeus TaxID=587636 RepID=A0A1H9TZX4_9MICO|nr:hypothetical protein SAMN05216199_1839 [Pedococcus cremeus]